MELQEIITEALKSSMILLPQGEDGPTTQEEVSMFIRELATKAFNAGKVSAMYYLEKNEVSFDGNYHLIGDKELEAARTPESV